MEELGEHPQNSPTKNAPPPREQSPVERRQKVWRDWIDTEFTKVTNGERTEEDLKNLLAEKFRQLDDELTKQFEISGVRKDLLTIDELTEIPNGVAFDEDIEECIGNNEKFGLLLMDIDNFKTLNTRYGHRGGDEAIRHLGRTLDSTLRTPKEDEKENRPGDTVYRLHGDEIAVLARGINDEKSLFMIAERLREAISQNPAKISSSENPVPITISIGGAIYKGESVEDFTDMVDKKALYNAKDNGKNNSHIMGYDPLEKEAA